MREVNFVRDIVYGIAHLLGIDPEEDLLKDHARGWANAINAAVREGWRFWPWPELEVTEERAFRQVWYTDVVYHGGQGEQSEFYYPVTQKYYRTTGNPPAGTLPTNATYFAEIAAGEFTRYLAYEQYGKQNIDRVIWMGNADPRTGGCAWTWHQRPSGVGLDLPLNSGPTIWVTYIPRHPQFTNRTYESDKPYNRGDLVLDLETGDCYVALAAGTGQALTLSAYWLRQQMPYVLAEYVKYSGAADSAEDLQTKSMWLAQADTKIKGEVDNLIAQGQTSFYGRKLRVPPKPFGISWDYYRAYWAAEAMA